MRRRRHNHRTLQFSRPVFTSRSRRLLLERLEDRALLDGAGLLEATPHVEAVDEGWKVVPGEFLVGLHTTQPIDDVAAYVEAVNWPAAIGSLDATNVHTVYQIPHRQDGQLTVVKVTLPAAVELDDAIAELTALEIVDYAEPNRYYDGNPFLAEPNDPMQFGTEHPAGDPVRYHHDKIRTPDAWDSFQPEWGGKGVVVAVIDSGVDYTHPDLYENIWINQGEIPPDFKDQLTHEEGQPITFADLNLPANANYVSDLNENEYIDAGDLLRPMIWDPATQINTGGWETDDPDDDEDEPDDDGNGYDDDLIGWDCGEESAPPDNDPMDEDWTWLYYGHGTHVAGLVAARTNNSEGVAGVAGQATIMPIRIDPFNAFTLAISSEALDYATKSGADIVNVSWNIPLDVQGTVFETFRNYLDAMYEAGVLAVFSAGNATEPNPGRQQYPQALFVAATDQNDRKVDFSNYGSGIDISAPGEHIYSTVPADEYAIPPYEFKGGTSMSAPIVAGTAALIWSAHPEWVDEADPTVIRDKVAAMLLGTADNIDDLNPRFINLLQGTVDPGEGMLGAGRVNAFEAVTQTLPDPPRIRGICEIPDGISLDMAELNVDVIGVFDGSTVTETVGSEAHLANWKLTYAGTIAGKYDREFDNWNGPDNGDDLEIGLIANLTPDYDPDPDKDRSYSTSEDYQIGMNTLKFTIDAGTLAEGYYRFEAVAKDPTSGDGLADPFGQALDGDGDGEAGGNYVYDFFVVDPDHGRWTGKYDLPTPSGEQEFKLASYGPHNEYLEAYFDGAPQPMQITRGTNPPVTVSVQKVLAGELSSITINGSSGSDLITIPASVQVADFNGPNPGTITLNSGTGDLDKAVLYGSDATNVFRGDYIGGDLTTRMPAELSNEYVTITLSTFDEIEVNAGTGLNGADLYDHPDTQDPPETFDASGNQATIDTDAWKNTVNGFDTVLFGQFDDDDDQLTTVEPLDFELLLVNPTDLLFWDGTDADPGNDYWYEGTWIALDDTEWYTPDGSEYPTQFPWASSHLIVRNDQFAIRRDIEVQNFTVSEGAVAHFDRRDLTVTNDLTAVSGFLAVDDLTVGGNVTAKLDSSISAAGNISVTGDVTGLGGIVSAKDKFDLGEGDISVGGSLRVDQGGAVIASSWHPEHGNISVTGDVAVALDSSISASGNITSVNGDLTVVGVGAIVSIENENWESEVGDISVGGNLQVDQGGAITTSSENPVYGNISVDGDVTVGLDSTISASGNISIDGDLRDHTWHLGAGTNGLLDAEGAVHLGTDNKLFLAPHGGDNMFTAGTYTLIEGDSFTGTFDFSDGFGGYAEEDDLTYAADSLTLTIDKDLHPGDANLDAATDLSDFNLWNANKFTSDTDWQEADFNGDVVTDLSDFNIWNANKFTVAGGGGQAAAAPAGGELTLAGSEGVQTMALPPDNMIDVYYDARIGWIGIDTTGASLVTLLVDGPPAQSILRWQDGTYQDGATWTQRYFNGSEQWGALAGGPVPESLYFLATYPTGLTADDFGPIEFYSNGEILYTDMQIVNGSQQSSAPSQMSAFWLEMAAFDAALASSRSNRRPNLSSSSQPNWSKSGSKAKKVSAPTRPRPARWPNRRSPNYWPPIGSRKADSRGPIRPLKAAWGFCTLAIAVVGFRANHSLTI